MAVKNVFNIFLLALFYLTFVDSVTTKRGCFTCVVTVQQFRTTDNNIICRYIRQYLALNVDGDATIGHTIGTEILPSMVNDANHAFQCETIRNAVWNHFYRRKKYLFWKIVIRPNTFDRPALEVCENLGYCDTHHNQGNSFPNVLPAHQAFQTRQQRLSYDAIRFQSITKAHPNPTLAETTLAGRIAAAELTISYDCRNAMANFNANNYYQTGWEHGHLQQYRQLVCNAGNQLLTGQSRYQKETYGMFYPGAPTVPAIEPFNSWATAHPMPANQGAPCAALYTDGQIGAVDDNGAPLVAPIQGTQVVHDKCIWLNNNNLGPASSNLLSQDRPRYAGINLFHFPHTYFPSSLTTYGRCTLHLNNHYKQVSSFLSRDAKALGCVAQPKYSNPEWYCMSSIDQPTHGVSGPCAVTDACAAFSANNAPAAYSGNNLAANNGAGYPNTWVVKDNPATTMPDVAPAENGQAYCNFEAFIHAKVLWNDITKITLDFYSVFGDNNQRSTLQWAMDTTHHPIIPIQWVWSMPNHLAGPITDGCGAFAQGTALPAPPGGAPPNVILSGMGFYIKGPYHPVSAKAYYCMPNADVNNFCINNNNHNHNGLGAPSYATIWADMAAARTLYDTYITALSTGGNVGVNALNIPTNGPYGGNALYYKTCIVEIARRNAYKALFDQFVTVAAHLP